MEPTRQRTKAGSRDKEFPTEWTLIDDAVSFQDEPQEEKSDSEEATGTMSSVGCSISSVEFGAEGDCQSPGLASTATNRRILSVGRD